MDSDMGVDIKARHNFEHLQGGIVRSINTR